MSRAKKRGRGAARWHKRSALHLRRKRQEEERKQKKAPNWSSGPFLILSRRRPTFPHSYPCSIIGPARLNFRVRDGNGCDPRGMTTGNLGKRLAIRYQITDIRKQERSCASKAFGKDWRGATGAPRTTVLAGEYKFGPLPNNYCVLQDVAEWSRNQPAMNSSQADRR